ncbi:f-box-like domain-containing protein [Ditylenchus destructor]|nr:f-box-like domain-containing protein [Ditylenchus destructor]
MLEIIRSHHKKHDDEKEANARNPKFFLPTKKHFRETEEWKKKRARILTKIRVIGRMNLAMLLQRMPTIEKLPDRVLQIVFSYLSPSQMLTAGRVCRRWKNIAYSPGLWQSVSFRATHGGLQVANLDHFLQVFGTRFTDMRNCELATDLITPNVLHEMANRCQRLQYLTLDFSTAMQLHDFTDLQTFPSRLKSLTLCLSENIFLEGFLRKVYTFISSVEHLHIVGTYEKVEDEEEEVYETINIFKLKQFLPNLRVVNLWGVPFITDDHVDALSSNCARLECLCVNYCTKVTGSSLKLVLQRCRRLTSLFLANAQLDNKIIQSIDWDKTQIEELDIRATELSTESIISILTRLPHLRWLDASWLENFTDEAVEAWMQSGTVQSLQYLNLDSCDSLSESIVTEFLCRHGYQLSALNLGGHHKMLEILVMGMAEDCCPKVTAKIHIDQFIDCIAQNCPKLWRLEIRWDDETLRFSDKSSKFIDVLRMKCLKLHSVVLSDGQYYELVRSNFERADRLSVVRTTEMCRTGILHCSKFYHQLLFN